MLVRRRTLATLASCWLLAVLASVTRADGPPTWQVIRHDDAITSWEKKRAQGELSAYRARVTMAADTWSILAVLEDVDRACEWTAHCDQMRRLGRTGPRSMRVYARMNAPWPVHDRDVVTHVTVGYGAEGALDVEIRNVDDAGPPAPRNVVRLPRMVAFYRFRALAPSRTQVEYELEVDPGGTLPDWLKLLISRSFAHDTLDRLRQRVAWANERGLYRARVAQLAAAAAEGGYRAQTVTASSQP